MNTLHQHFKYYESANNNSTNSNEYEKEEKKYTTVVKLSKEASKAMTNSILRAQRGENNSNSNVVSTYPTRRAKTIPPQSVAVAPADNYNGSNENNSNVGKSLNQRRLSYAQDIHGLPRPTTSGSKSPEAVRRQLHSNFRKSLSATLRKQREDETDWVTQLRRGEEKAMKALQKKGGARKTRRHRHTHRKTRSVQNRRR